MIAVSEVFSASLTALRRNKTRSMLTALGIIIGVAAVIAAFAVGAGANKSIDEQISSFGSNFIMVFPDRPGRSTTGVTRYLTYDDALAIEKEVSGVDAVAPMINMSATLVYENTNWSSSVVGSTKEYAYVQDWNLGSGRDINASDVRQGAKVAVVGQTVVDKLFSGENPIGKAVRINKIPFTVVGVFEAKGLSAMGSDQDDFVLVPLTAAQRRLVRWKTAGRIGNIYIKGVSMEALSYIQNETEALLRERHKIKPGDPDDFAVRNVSQMLEARRKTTTIMSMLLGSIAFISLVVGGIGIMNIMLVSVTERTRNRHPDGGRRYGKRHPGAVPHRGGRPLDDRRRHRDHARRGGGIRAFLIYLRAAGLHADVDRACLRLLGDGRRGVRLLSRLQGFAAQPDRRAEIRITGVRESVRKGRPLSLA